MVVNQSSGHFQNGQCTLLCDFQGLPLFRDEGMKRVLPGIAIMCHAHYRERGVLSKLVAPRLFALFCGGWLLFNFPLPGLWVLDLTLMGVPLLLAAWLGLWAGLIGTLACLIERHTKTEKVHSPCCHQCWLVALHWRICCFCLGWQAGGWLARQGRSVIANPWTFALALGYPCWPTTRLWQAQGILQRRGLIEVGCDSLQPAVRL